MKHRWRLITETDQGTGVFRGSLHQCHLKRRQIGPQLGSLRVKLERNYEVLTPLYVGCVCTRCNGTGDWLPGIHGDLPESEWRCKCGGNPEHSKSVPHPERSSRPRTRLCVAPLVMAVKE